MLYKLACVLRFNVIHLYCKHNDWIHIGLSISKIQKLKNSVLLHILHILKWIKNHCIFFDIIVLVLYNHFYAKKDFTINVLGKNSSISYQELLKMICTMHNHIALAFLGLPIVVLFSFSFYWTCIERIGKMPIHSTFFVFKRLD